MSEGTAATKRQKVYTFRDRVHTLLQQPQHSNDASFYRIEWFHEHTYNNPPGSLGIVKFVLVVGINPKKEYCFSVRMGYAVVKPANVPEARGAYQDYGWTRGFVRKKFDESIEHALGIMTRTQIKIEDIEEALDKTLRLKRQPYTEDDYSMDALEEKLSELYNDGVSCIASGLFRNPLHPHLKYRLVGQKQETTVRLHCVGIPADSRRISAIEDIRTHEGTICEVVEKFQGSLAHSYISPEQLARAITQFQPRDAEYFR